MGHTCSNKEEGEVRKKSRLCSFPEWGIQKMTFYDQIELAIPIQGILNGGVSPYH